MNNFLLEGEVTILNKTVRLPNAFMCKAERLKYNLVHAKFVKLPANLWSREDILNWLYNYLKDLIMCTHTHTFFGFGIRRSRYNYGDDDTLASEWHIWIIIVAPHPHPPKSIFRYGYPLVKKKMNHWLFSLHNLWFGSVKEEEVLTKLRPRKVGQVYGLLCERPPVPLQGVTWNHCLDFSHFWVALSSLKNP